MNYQTFLILMVRFINLGLLILCDKYNSVILDLAKNFNVYIGQATDKISFITLGMFPGHAASPWL